LDSNVRNPWFREWFSSILNCNISGEQCPRNQSVPQLLDTFHQGQKTALVIDAVYAFAHALHDFLMENCAQPLQWFSNNRTCSHQTRELNGSTLLQYVHRVNFTSPTSARVTFDQEGNAPGSYDIVNHQVILGGTTISLSFETVGTWTSVVSSGSTIHFISRPQFRFDAIRNEVVSIPSESHCNRCPPGRFQRQVQSSCCGICDPCLGKYYSSDLSSTNCSLCSSYSWGNNPLVGNESCVAIPEVFLSFKHPYSIIITIIALVGLLLVCLVLVIFAFYWKTPVVKSSGQEQMVTLLVGVSLSFISSFFYISSPNPVSCGLQRWSLWIAFSVMFGALLVKVVRVARIFLQKKSYLKRPKFTEPHYQVLFTFAITSFQLFILVVSTPVNVPEVLKESRMNTTDPNVLPSLVVTCQREHSSFLFISLAYHSILLFLCTVFGAMSFKYPENFNEAKYIALCSVSVSVIWIAFIITFFATQSMQEFQNIAISLAIVMSGYAVLLAVFGPKIYIVLFKPEQNNTNRSRTVPKDSMSQATVISNL